MHWEVTGVVNTHPCWSSGWQIEVPVIHLLLMVPEPERSAVLQCPAPLSHRYKSTEPLHPLLAALIPTLPCYPTQPRLISLPYCHFFKERGNRYMSQRECLWGPCAVCSSGEFLGEWQAVPVSRQLWVNRCSSFLGSKKIIKTWANPIMGSVACCKSIINWFPLLMCFSLLSCKKWDGYAKSSEWLIPVSPEGSP